MGKNGWAAFHRDHVEIVWSGGCTGPYLKIRALVRSVGHTDQHTADVTGSDMGGIGNLRIARNAYQGTALEWEKGAHPTATVATEKAILDTCSRQYRSSRFLLRSQVDLCVVECGAKRTHKHEYGTVSPKKGLRLLRHTLNWNKNQDTIYFFHSKNASLRE